MSTLVKMSNCWKSHELARGCSSDILTGITVFDGALQRLLHKSIVTTSHRAGERRGFDFLATGLWYDLVLTAHLPGLCVATNDWCT